MGEVLGRFLELISWSVQLVGLVRFISQLVSFGFSQRFKYDDNDDIWKLINEDI